MLQISPQDAILFTKAGNELVGMVEITNIIQAPVTYKVKIKLSSIHLHIIKTKTCLVPDQNNITGKVSRTTEYWHSITR